MFTSVRKFKFNLFIIKILNQSLNIEIERVDFHMCGVLGFWGFGVKGYKTQSDVGNQPIKLHEKFGIGILNSFWDRTNVLPHK